MRVGCLSEGCRQECLAGLLFAGGLIAIVELFVEDIVVADGIPDVLDLVVFEGLHCRVEDVVNAFGDDEQRIGDIHTELASAIIFILEQFDQDAVDGNLTLV